MPAIQEFWGTAGDAAIRTNQIAAQVQCELAAAVQTLMKKDELYSKSNNDGYSLSWLNNWGFSVLLLLSVEEKSSVSPGVSFVNPLLGGDSRSLGLGGHFSTKAGRIDKINFFYTVPYLMKLDRAEDCLTKRPAGGSLFVQSDLKIYEWLSAALLPQYTSSMPSFAYVKDTKLQVLSHDIKFDIITNAGMTPSWKLVRFTGGSSPGNNSLFGIERNRAQQLVITGGLTEVEQGKPALARSAEGSRLASEIGAEVARSVRVFD